MSITATATKTTKHTPTGDVYDAHSITSLSGLEAVRKRPGMYIGSVDVSGLRHLLWEALDNSIDEAAEGHGKVITVKIHKDDSYSVMDRGRGIPVGDQESGRSALEVVFTELHAGGKFNSRSYSSSGGIHGVGAAVINALSERVQIRVKRNQKTWGMDFWHRQPGLFHKKAFVESRKPAIISSKSRGTGTTVRFWPDRDIFDPADKITFQDVRNRLQEMSWLLPGVQLKAVCEITGKKWETRSQKGLTDCLDEMTGNSKSLSGVVEWEDEMGYTERVPDETGVVVETDRMCRVTMAFRWMPKGGEIKSYVNTVPTPDGGKHVAGFVRALVKEIRDELAARNPVKLRKLTNPAPIKEDCLHGLHAVIRVQVPEPQFTSQTKTRLGTKQISTVVNAITRKCLSAYINGEIEGSYKSHIEAILKQIVDRIVERSLDEDAFADNKEIAKLRRSAALAKLSDCRTHPAGELLIVEGDSAAGPAKRVRDSYWQAVLPIRGKIINAAKGSTSHVMSNTEVRALISAIGAGSGKTFNLSKSRYSRIILLADADVDGSHIRCLLLTLFQTLMRPLFESGRVFSAQPPTHVLITKGNKQYFYSEEEMNRTLASLNGTKHRITRFKGLGEMNDNELLTTCIDPTTRILRPITVVDEHDAADADKTIQALLGRNVATRKHFIENQATEYRSLLDI